MSSATVLTRRTPARPEQVATRLVFFVAGCGMAAWAPLVPFAKLRAGLGEGALGLLLLCVGIGSTLSMPLAGALTGRFGCRVVIVGSALLLCLTLPVLATAANPALLAVALLAFGVGLGSLDVTMNIQAIIVERAAGRPMMSGFHGLFSLGGMVGAAAVAALLGGGVTPLAAVSLVIAGLLATLAVSARDLLPYASREHGPAFALPRGALLVIGLLCFVAFLTEGAVLDWSAVFLTQVRGIDPAYGGLGYAAFALTMTIGRLTGDRQVKRWGGGNVILFGGSAAAAGLALAALAPQWPLALFGYALVGAGAANIVPVLFSGLGRQTDMPENLAMTAVMTLGYAGILSGPAAVGWIAQVAGLSPAFLLLAFGLLAVAVVGQRLQR